MMELICHSKSVNKMNRYRNSIRVCKEPIINMSSIIPSEVQMMKYTAHYLFLTAIHACKLISIN